MPGPYPIRCRGWGSHFTSRPWRSWKRRWRASQIYFEAFGQRAATVIGVALGPTLGDAILVTGNNLGCRSSSIAVPVIMVVAEATLTVGGRVIEFDLPVWCAG